MEFPHPVEEPVARSSPGKLSGVYIQVADGTKLAVDVLLPRAIEGRKFTTVLIMTRYWRGVVGGGLSRWQTFFAKHGFAVVQGDVRGTGASFGQWPHHRSRAETLDFTDIMDWVVSQPWSDGRIVGTGTSYLANTADWMAERQHRALEVVISRFADYDPYADLYFPGGVPNAYMGEKWGQMVKDLDLNIRREANGDLSPGVRPVDEDEGSKMLQAALKEHSSVPSVWEGLQQVTCRDDGPELWDNVSLTDFGICSHMDRVRQSGVSMQNWAGWMDAGTASGSIHRFRALPDSVHVVIGPWNHAGSHVFDPMNPEVSQVEPSYSQQQVENLVFIQQSLAGSWKGGQKRLSYYTCGEGKWKTTTIWPLPTTRFEDWFLGSQGTLSETSVDTGMDTYKVDYGVGTGEANRWATNKTMLAVSYGDRSEIDKRLLCYTSSPLPSDVEITGHPILTLFLASSEHDGAVFAYLELVSTEGKVIYLTEGQLRLIHRRVSVDSQVYPQVSPYHSFLRKDAMPMVPGERVEIAFALHPISRAIVSA
ncbi:unnamed protein product [Clonostachys rosea]|uniref:Xaa-Pro dipeptidyl-peptidase C-terminal domain-containing protein n=1 Tax=Bionectria ochroleuca TaxID=29856 RepID=A0ABY6TSU9_BIOOC|nr:unnamed protein product [Clonostachys rosea]